MHADFLDANPRVTWTTGVRGVRGELDGVQLDCEPRWWGDRWTVVAESRFPVPEKLILFVSARGMDHGFWRDLLVGDRAFDAAFFIFCDTPALLPMVLGEATRRALRDWGPNRHDLTLYVRDHRVHTTGITTRSDPTTIARHLAIHRALAEDHRTCLTRWQHRIEEAHGRATATWPPTATLLRPSGALVVNLRWSAPTTRDASSWDEAAMSLRTEVTGHDDNPRRRWSLTEVAPTAACTHVLGARRFVLVGELALPLAMLDDVIARAGITSIAIRTNRITIGLQGLANPRQIEGAVRVIEQVVAAATASTSPYR